MGKETSRQIQSMTGYGRGSASSQHFFAQAELRSVNGRFLEVRSKLSRALSFCEPHLREIINAELKRGMVDLQLSLQWKKEAARTPVDEDLVQAYSRATEELATKLGIPAGANALGLLRLPGAVSQEEVMTPELEQEALKAASEACKLAVRELVGMREREGERLREFLLRDLEMLEKMWAKIAEFQKQKPELLEKRLQARIEKTLKDFSVNVEPSRITQELAFYLDRGDITEELDRLESHFAEMTKALRSGGAAGKRCDFLLQEIGREINTLSAKADILEVTQVAIEMKLLAEKLKEQVQNLE